MVDGHLGDIGHVLELVLQESSTAVSAGQEDLAPFGFADECLSQGLRSVGFRDKVRAEMEFGQDFRGGRSDRRDSEVAEARRSWPQRFRRSMKNRTPLDEVKTSQSNSRRRLIASSSGVGSVIGRISTLGARTASAPSDSRTAAARPASWAGRVTKIRCPKSGSLSYQSRWSRRATTAPTTKRAGGRTPTFSAVSRSVASVATCVRCTASVPDSMIAAGVSPGFPSRISDRADGGQVCHTHVDHQCTRETG